MRDPMGRYFCQIVGVGMFDSVVNVTLPFTAAKELAAAILNGESLISEIK